MRKRCHRMIVTVSRSSAIVWLAPDLVVFSRTARPCPRQWRARCSSVPRARSRSGHRRPQMLPRRRPVAEASLRNAYILVRLVGGRQHCFHALDTRRFGHLLNLPRWTSVGGRVGRDPVVRDCELEAGADDAVNAHDGGGRERLAVRTASFESEVQAVEIRWSDLLNPLLAERRADVAIEEDLRLVSSGLLVAGDRQPLVRELVERDARGGDSACGGLREQLSLLLLGFALGSPAGPLHGGVEVLLPAVAISSCVDADLEAVAAAADHGPTIWLWVARGVATPAPRGRPPPERGPDLRFCGADDGIRTRDPNLGKVVLYQLSHVRVGHENSANRSVRSRPGAPPPVRTARTGRRRTRRT